MAILKPMMFDSYAYQIGQFPIASADLGKLKSGMFCKLNSNQEICMTQPGEKGFMMLFPKEAGRKGFAILHGAFYVGAYTLNIDEDCFDSSKTYTASQTLYVGQNGKLTNDDTVSENPIPVARVLRPKKAVGEKQVLAITSINGCI